MDNTFLLGGGWAAGAAFVRRLIRRFTHIEVNGLSIHKKGPGR